MDLSINRSDRELGGRVAHVLSVAGAVDVYTSPRLREALSQAIDAGCTDLVVDLDQVSFLDSTGLGVLVGGLKRVRSVGGTLVVVCTRDRVLTVVSLTGLDRVFRIVDSLDAA